MIRVNVLHLQSVHYVQNSVQCVLRGRPRSPFVTELRRFLMQIHEIPVRPLSQPPAL
jgi:hypothetical protein